MDGEIAIFYLCFLHRLAETLQALLKGTFVNGMVQNDEFIAPETVAAFLPEGLLQLAAKNDQSQIAALVAMKVIDPLEVIDVNDEEIKILAEVFLIIGTEGEAVFRLGEVVDLAHCGELFVVELQLFVHPGDARGKMALAEREVARHRDDDDDADCHRP